MSKIKRDAKQQIEDAVKDFKTLIIYFDVTRPQYESEFKDNGEFSTKKLTSIAHYLSRGTKRLDKEELRRYNKLSAVYNYTFGIPRELVQRVLGYFTLNGKYHKIPVSKIVEHLVKIGFIEKPTGNGVKVRKDKKNDGKYKVVCYWHKKYLLKNEKYWFQLMSDKRYSKIETYPNASERVKKIILKWHSEQMPKKKTEASASETSNLEKKNADIPTAGQTADNDLEVKLDRFCEGMKSYVHPIYYKTVDKLKNKYIRLKKEVYDIALKSVKLRDRSILEKLRMIDIDEDICELMVHFWCRYTKTQELMKQKQEVA